MKVTTSAWKPLLHACTIMARADQLSYLSTSSARITQKNVTVYHRRIGHTLHHLTGTHRVAFLSSVDSATHTGDARSFLSSCEERDYSYGLYIININDAFSTAEHVQIWS